MKKKTTKPTWGEISILAIRAFGQKKEDRAIELAEQAQAKAKTIQLTDLQAKAMNLLNQAMLQGVTYCHQRIYKNFTNTIEQINKQNDYFCPNGLQL